LILSSNSKILFDENHKEEEKITNTTFISNIAILALIGNAWD